MLGNAVLTRLREAGVGVRHDVALSSLTTLRLGGPAATVLHCASTDAVTAAVRACDDGGEATLLLGGGSNLVVADAGFDGTVVAVATDEVTMHPDGVSAAAGTGWDALVATTVAHGLGGLECLSGIPGSTGATPVQNVGAYGVEVADVLAQVQLLDRASAQVRRCGPEVLGMGYRTSALKHTDTAVVLSVRFTLDPSGAGAPVRYAELAAALGVAPGQSAPAARVREAVLALRTGKAMVLDAAEHDTWSAGSFFTNPVVAEIPVAYTGPVHPADGGHKLSAGWLIEHAGFTRGYPGPAAPVRLSTRHTLALTNRGGARTTDLLELAREVRAGVQSAYGVVLAPEPVLVGCTL